MGVMNLLSLSNVKMVQAASYYDKDDYYTRSSDNHDMWQGKLSEQYGQSNNLTAGEFNAALRSMPNPERAATDLTFSAPKSVSIAMVLDEVKKADMIAAHNQAVADTLEQIERNEIQARVTQNGITERYDTGNMAVAKFNHFVSRNQDMQLHTHAVILNRTEYNGKSYAISNENLYENHILYGQLYRNRLAANLQEMGYECKITDHEKGFFELKGIDEATIKQFSTRRAEILEKLKEWNADSAIAADRATLLTRTAKVNRDIRVLEKSWREQLNGEVSLQKGETMIHDNSERSVAFQKAVSRLAENQFAFSGKELERAVLAEGCITGMNRDDFQQNLKHSDVISLDRIGENKTVYYTTAQNIAIEQEINDNVKNSQKIKPLDKVETQLQKLAKTENLTLSSEQEKAVLHIAKTPKQYAAVQGLAGSGKTYMLLATRQIFEENGYVVKGMSFSGKAAENLQKEASIKSSTLHSFFNKLEKEAGNHSGIGSDIKKMWNFEGLKADGKPQLWIVDEAGMTDNNLILHLQRAAALKNAKVVLVGDYQQLVPVGAGNAYSKFVRNGEIPTCYLSNIQRQKNNVDLLNAVKEAVSGDVDKSLMLLKDSTKEIKMPNKRFKAIAEEYSQMTSEAQDKTIVLTAKNKDRVTINEKIRNSLIKKGGIDEAQGKFVKIAAGGSEEVSRNFAPNDKIIFLKNDYKLGVKNGQIGKVKGFDGKNMIVGSNDKLYKVNLNEYNDVDHGYCITVHKAQGITVDKAIINLDSSQRVLNTRNAYYVNVSRARNSVSIYTDNQAKIGQQVNEWVKKVTSEDFLIKMSPVGKTSLNVKAPLPSKLSISMPTIPIPVIGTLLSIPLKVVGLGVKIGMKAVKTAIDLPTKIAKMNPEIKQGKGRHM